VADEAKRTAVVDAWVSLRGGAVRVERVLTAMRGLAARCRLADDALKPWTAGRSACAALLEAIVRRVGRRIHAGWPTDTNGPAPAPPNATISFPLRDMASRRAPAPPPPLQTHAGQRAEALSRRARRALPQTRCGVDVDAAGAELSLQR
jgi:hypothetical protein